VKPTLYIVGAIFELVGIVMLAAPDWNTYTRRLGSLTRRIFDRVLALIRRLLRRPKHVTAHAVDLGLAIETNLSGSAIVGQGPGASIEDRIAFLLRRDEQTQRDVNELRGRVEAIERESPEKLAALRVELEQHVSTQLEIDRADYRAGRALGAVLLAIGLGISTAGNLVH
jgi:hypothetical protein